MESETHSAFLRDILHYHYSRLEELWCGVKQLSEDQFRYSEPGQSNSICNILARQVAEEYNCYQSLTGGAKLLDPSTLFTKFPSCKHLFLRWKETCFLLRQHAARLTDEDYYASIPGRQEAVREVYLHLLDFGAQQGGEIRRRLQAFGIYIEEQTVMSFFYDEIKRDHPHL